MEERLTSQKQIILDYLMGVKIHPTAEMVYSAVRKKLPRISQGTVYRILNNFVNKGNAQVISTKGLSHYDGDMSYHAHFICDNCDKVFDVFDTCPQCDVLRKKRVKVGKVNHYKIYFYGTCNKCKK